LGLLFIWFVYTICLYSWLDMAKVYYGVRFEPSLHSSFKAVAGASGCTVTSAFERFMRSCVEAGSLVFVEKGVLDFEVEARVLVDWLCKGKCFFRDQDGEEVNIQGRLLSILPRVQDVVLKREIEETLKQSVSLKE
jgi:hypothetical protein